MTAWHALQLLLAGAAVFYAARGVLRVNVRGDCDPSTLIEALATSLGAGQLDLARSIAAECRPAWVAQVSSAALDAQRVGSPARRAGDDRLNELESEAAHGLATLASLGRMASPLAFLAIVVELAGAFGGGHGLRALQRGLIESVALSHALLSFALGASTALLCALAAAQLRYALRQLRADAHRALSVVAAHEPRTPM